MRKEHFSVWLSRLAIVLIASLSVVRAQEEGPNGHYYKVVMEPNLLWQDAKAHAEQSTYNGVHGYLATITSPEEDQFIENLRQQAAPGGYGSLWVGGSQVGTALGPTDGWYWVNGEGPIPTSAGGDGYSNWQPGEPNDYWGAGSEGYLSVGHFNTFGWNDEPNDGHITGYVVEYPSRGTTSQVSVRAVDPVAAEHPEIAISPDSVDRAAFVFYRTGDLTLDLPVFYSVHGTAMNGIDYIEIARSIIIPAGKSEVRLEIAPNQDLVLDGEAMETVGIRIEPSQILTPTAAYYIDQNQREAGAVIYDSRPPGIPTAEVAIPRKGFSYAADEPVVFLVAMYSDISVTTVEFDVDGVSVGTTYDTERTTGLRFLKFIWAGATPGTHTLMAHALATSRPSTTIQFSVEGTPEPTKVGIRYVEPDTSPVPDADFAVGSLEVTRTGSTAQNLQVFYSVGGTATADVDYEALQGYVVIPAGKASAKIIVAAKDDTIDEPDETVVVTLINSPNTTDAAAQYIVDADHATAQVTILDNDPPVDFPLVRIDTIVDHSSEDGSDAFGKFRISRSGSTALDLIVVMQYGGTATPDVDYHKLPEHVTIPAGAQATEISVEPIADQIVEGDETVIAMLAPIKSVYNIDQSHQSATVVIRDVAPPPLPLTVVRIESTDKYAVEQQPEGGQAMDPAIFRVSRSGDTTGDLQVFYSVHGTATNGEDYDLLPGTITIPAGSASAEIRIVPHSDTPSTGHKYEIVQQPGLSWAQARELARQHVYLNVIGHLATITSAAEDATIESLRQEAGGPVLWVGGYQDPTELSVKDNWKWVNDEGPIPGVNGGTTGYAHWQEGEPNDFWGAGSENAMAIGWLNQAGWNDQGTNVGTGGFVIEYDVDDPIVSQREIMETVGIRLEPSPSLVPIPPYVVHEVYDSAGAVIVDGQPALDGELEIAIPSANEVFQGNDVEFIAMAEHPTTQIIAVDFYIDDVRVGSSSVDPASIVGGVVEHHFKWTPPVNGQHVLQAKAILGGGRTLTSSRIPFRVDGAANTNPIAKITKPADGAAFLETDTIHVVANATDADGTIAKIEILLDDIVIASNEGASIEKDFTATVGAHTLTARAKDNAGGIGVSAPVHILVRHPDTVAFVRRELPAGYSPGVSFVVALRADPPEGTFAYAVEDRPPTGWQVTDVSSDGAFDATTGKVKFGPFTDDAARTLTYRVTPPTTASGRYEFGGSSSVNGALYPITGDMAVELVQQFHPADSNQDWQISLAEVTAYAAAWKAGNTWPTGPVPIPMRYVTRAHLIWQHGEVYRFEPAAGAPPACWVAGNSGPRAALVIGTIGGAERSVISDLRSGAAAQVQITATPATGSSGYAVEEKPPRGWVVSNISNDGVFDAVTGTIRWGVFADTTTRVLSYTVTPPPTVTSVGVFAGQISFDGQVVEISALAGMPNSVTSSGATEIRINNFTQTATGTALNISGPAGQTAVIESSTDFTDWTEVKSIFIPNGSVDCTDESASGGRRFYRLRVQ